MNIEDIKPAHDMVAVIKDEPEMKSKGGLILLTEKSTTKNIEGNIIAVGKGRKNSKNIVIEAPVNVGDRVLLSPNALGNNKIVVDDKTVYFVKPDEIYAII